MGFEKFSDIPKVSRELMPTPDDPKRIVEIPLTGVRCDKCFDLGMNVWFDGDDSKQVAADHPLHMGRVDVQTYARRCKRITPAGLVKIDAECNAAKVGKK